MIYPDTLINAVRSRQSGKPLRIRRRTRGQYIGQYKYRYGTGHVYHLTYVEGVWSTVVTTYANREPFDPNRKLGHAKKRKSN